ncbi:MAG: menaquinone biosynthesis protein [Bacteroidales bacterium]|jgi:chorismate dehydratase
MKISLIPFLNTLPFVYGLKKKPIDNKTELLYNVPSVAAEKLLNNKVDIGIVPVAVIPLLKEYYIYSDYCIGAVGKAKTVELYSNVPLNKIEKIFLDCKSKTSINLVRILAQKYWRINPEWLNAEENYIDNIENNIAGVVIGDKNFELKDKFEYVFDLADEWRKFTSLPFVFACWIANKKLHGDFIDKFNAAIKYGVENKKAVISEWYANNDNPYNINLREYLFENLSYEFDDLKKKGMMKFLEYLKEIKK